MNQYESWQAFTFKGKRYLCLTIKGGSKCLIVGEGMDNYGTYFDRESFEKMASREGDVGLCLGKF